MRRITFSVLSVLLALPAFGAARLPVVNISAGGVSARAAFGEGVQPAAVPVQKSASANVATRNAVAANVVAADTVPSVARTDDVVAVAPVKAAPKKVSARPAVDSGAKIAAVDVLSPNRPSSDLWAKNDVPLRMPDPSEFSVLSADYQLPEEGLTAATAPRVAAVAPVSQAPAQQPMSAMDEQIARLVELQKRADESIKSAAASAPVMAAAPLDVMSPLVVDGGADENIARAPQNDTPADAVRLSRLVVPMAPDVVVRTVEKNTSPRIAAVRDDMTKMSPTELRKAFRKTFLSENKHLSTFQIDDRFDVASDMSSSIEGFTANRDLSETGGIRPLEIKIRFRNEDSALSRENYNLLTEYASIVVSNPKRAIQVAIPQNVATNMDARKLAAKRLAIVEQVLRDTGVAEQRIVPVLSQRDEEGFVLRIISNDQFETLTQQQRNMFGDTVSQKTYKSMSW